MVPAEVRRHAKDWEHQGEVDMRRSDEQIKKDIVDELYWDSRIDASEVTVTVKNGVVTLEGTVPTYADLSAARSAAWRMEGVTNVTDHLTVRHISPPALPTDDEIRTAVENTLAWEPAIHEGDIRVSVANGVVTLEGTVETYWKKPYAENRVSGIRGILGIENKLAVVPSKKVEDEVVAQDVVAALDRDVLVDTEMVHVTVNDGVVTLSGTVPGWASRRAAEDDAALTVGVVGVRNELDVAA